MSEWWADIKQVDPLIIFIGIMFIIWVMRDKNKLGMG